MGHSGCTVPVHSKPAESTSTWPLAASLLGSDAKLSGSDGRRVQAMPFARPTVRTVGPSWSKIVYLGSAVVRTIAPPRSSSAVSLIVQLYPDGADSWSTVPLSWLVLPVAGTVVETTWLPA